MIDRVKERFIMKTLESLKIIHPGQNRRIVFDEMAVKREPKNWGQKEEQVSLFRCIRRTEKRIAIPNANKCGTCQHSFLEIPTSSTRLCTFLLVPPALPSDIRDGTRKNSWHCFLNAIILYFLSRMPDVVGLFFADRRRGFKLIVYFTSNARSNWMHNLHCTSWRSTR